MLHNKFQTSRTILSGRIRVPVVSGGDLGEVGCGGGLDGCAGSGGGGVK